MPWLAVLVYLGVIILFLCVLNAGAEDMTSILRHKVRHYR